MIAQTLSHYKILDKLGEGGMGEVYLAEDTTLKRKVALKVLPADLASSQERLERFQREAEALAALDHPNIVTIHTVEEAEGTRFLTMQLVDGKPLSELIPPNGMALEQIFTIATPIADALASAHEKGIIHRDLKPGNVMVTTEGRVKVLDFGLAKLRQEPAAPVATQAPTEPLTGQGRALGTVPYMSPEQIEGLKVDPRSDIFSLGVVLYEMATGHRPFSGDGYVALISSIVKDTPAPLDSTRTELPHHLSRVVTRCLEKDPERRYQSAKDVRNELEDLKGESDTGELLRRTAHPITSKGGTLTAWVLSAVLAFALGAVAFVAFQRNRQERLVRIAESKPISGTFSQVTFDPGLEAHPSLSPDGRFFVYAGNALGNWDIYFQRIGGGKAINLTEASSDDDYHPAFSPDGERIAFRSERNGGGLYTMGATGESLRLLTNFGFFPRWSSGGKRIVFSTRPEQGWQVDSGSSRIWTVDVESGEGKMVMDSSALGPDWSPGDARIAYWAPWNPSESTRQVDIFTIAADGGTPVPVTQDTHIERSPIWSPDGRYLYFISNRSGIDNLWRVAIDEQKGAVLGGLQPITSGTRATPYRPWISNDGRILLYAATLSSTRLERLAFDPVAGQVAGAPVPITGTSLDASYPSISPDNQWIAFDASFGQPGGRAIGVIGADGSGLRQLTESGFRDRHPTWSPDGRRLAFFGNRSGKMDAWIINADGSELRQLTDEPSRNFDPPIWSPDGSQIAVAADGVTYVFEVDKPWSEKPPMELPPWDGGDGGAYFSPVSWSPNGKFLAGDIGSQADLPNEEGITVYSFENGTYERFTESGVLPVWLNDNRRLLFTAGGDATAQVHLLDLETGEHREVLSNEVLPIAPDLIAMTPTPSPDNRDLYFVRLHLESDIWMLTFEDRE